MSLLSLTFISFIAVTFLLYWNVKNPVAKNLILAISSIAFYATGGIEMALIFISIATFNYLAGNYIIAHSGAKARALCTATIVLNIGTLILFKYLNFFSAEISNMLRLAGIRADDVTLNLIAPLGLSFYIFMLISHVIDCKRGIFEKKVGFVEFIAYTSFFPHFFAGPIDRSRKILPQLHAKRSFDFKQAREGLWQILNGLFKKMAIADVCAVCINKVWGDIGQYSMSTLWIVVFLYSIQIYCDFSGFSDIAIGVGKLFGLRLMENFKRPYFSRNVSEFWRRWHISLTSWFTEYVYIPLGGSRRGLARTCINTMVIFVLCGMWHGASAMYLIWGAISGLMFMPYLLQPNKRKYKGEDVSLTIGNLAKIIITFVVISLSFIPFRGAEAPAGSVMLYISRMVSFGPGVFYVPFMKPAILASVVIILAEWITRRHEFALAALQRVPRLVRWLVYLVLTVVIFGVYLILPAEPNADEFIYQNF